jgi:hypothetical protein
MVCTTLDIESPIQAVCGKAARTDLGGGREVTRVPTAKLRGCRWPVSLPMSGSIAGIKRALIGRVPQVWPARSHILKEFPFTCPRVFREVARGDFKIEA